LKYPSHTGESEKRTEPIKVLIVEDDPMVADINRKFTEAVEGFTVLATVKTGKEAIDFLNRRPVDLIILDIYLPDKSGLEVLATIRRDDRPVDVIMITAADDSGTVGRVMRYGVVAYIAKPFKFDRYRATLEAYRNFRAKLTKKSNLAQEDIDSLLAVAPVTQQEDTPKNLNTQTMNMIIEYMAGQTETLSAEEVAAGVGLARVTARRYLDHMVQQGVLRKTMEYVAVGRPVHRFKILGQPR
jgi:two-component system response regulator DctR